MWPLKSIFSEKTSTVLRVSTHIYGDFSEDRMGKHNIFQSKPKHVTPQIDCLGKTSTVLRFSTHIYSNFEKIDGKMFIFQSKPMHVTPQIDCLTKMSTVLRVSAHIYSKEIDGKMFILRLNLGIWHLKSIILEKRALFWGFQHTFMGCFSGDRWENVHFEIKPRHVTPQIDCLRITSTVLRV